MKHTKEPWHVCDGLISSEKKEAIALVEHSSMYGPASPTGSANARRIVAALKDCIYTAENFGIPYAGRDARDRAKVIIKKYDHA